MSEERITGKYRDKYVPIVLDSLRLDSLLDFDLYLPRGDEMILYRSSQLPFCEKTRRTLLENSVRRLYVSVNEWSEYQRYVEGNLTQIIASSDLDDNIKAGIIYEAAERTIKDVFDNPQLGENIRRSQNVVANTVSFVIRDQTAFKSMIEVMSFDYKTYTHSLNVCTFSIALAQHIGITNEAELCRLGIGALLHDVGKTRIDDRILNKRGALSEDEMEIIRQHPRLGVELMQETKILEEESYLPILEHHEREDGSGYPRGITSEQIHPHSKIVAVADVFDAMTTRRCYREAVNTFPALMVMFSEKNTFDFKLLEHFTRLLGPVESVLPAVERTP